MKTLVYYIQIISWMEEMQERETLFASQLAYGNVAYFVEGYVKESEFSDYIEKIRKWTRNNAVNELCWNMNLWISQLMEDAFNMEKNHNKEKKEYLEFQLGLLEEDYRNGQCDDFWLADETMFPEWFWEYYGIKMTEK